MDPVFPQTFVFRETIFRATGKFSDEKTQQFQMSSNISNLLKEYWVINKDAIDSPFVAVEESNSFNAISNFNLHSRIDKNILASTIGYKTT